MNRDAAADPAPEAPSDPLPDLPEHLLAGYLDAALETLRRIYGAAGHDPHHAPARGSIRRGSPDQRLCGSHR